MSKEEKKGNLSKEEFDALAQREAMLKAQKDQEGATKERDDKCIPLAKQLFKTVAEHVDDIKMGSDIKPNEFKEVYKPIVLAGIKQHLENDLKLEDIGYIHSLLNDVIAVFNEQMQRTINEHTKRADALLWGSEYDQLTITKVHEVLLDASEKSLEEPVENTVDESEE